MKKKSNVRVSKYFTYCRVGRANQLQKLNQKQVLLEELKKNRRLRKLQLFIVKGGVKLNTKHELAYVVMSDEEITEFSYNITSDEIGQYVSEHKVEFEIWKGLEYIKKLIRSALNVCKPIDISIRRKFLKNLRKKGVITDEQGT